MCLNKIYYCYNYTKREEWLLVRKFSLAMWVIEILNVVFSSRELWKKDPLTYHLLYARIILPRFIRIPHKIDGLHESGFSKWESWLGKKRTISCKQSEITSFLGERCLTLNKLQTKLPRAGPLQSHFSHDKWGLLMATWLSLFPNCQNFTLYIGWRGTNIHLQCTRRSYPNNCDGEVRKSLY